MLRFEYTEANKPDNVNLKAKNSGISWQSMFNVTRIGHGGSDPGVKTEMLSDLSKRVAVVLSSNTSPSDEDMGKHAAIFNALWKQAEELNSGQQR